jgi:hypothetical protein
MQSPDILISDLLPVLRRMSLTFVGTCVCLRSLGAPGACPCAGIFWAGRKLLPGSLKNYFRGYLIEFGSEGGTSTKDLCPPSRGDLIAIWRGIPGRHYARILPSYSAHISDKNSSGVNYNVFE